MIRYVISMYVMNTYCLLPIAYDPFFALFELKASEEPLYHKLYIQMRQLISYLHPPPSHVDHFLEIKNPVYSSSTSQYISRDGAFTRTFPRRRLGWVR